MNFLEFILGLLFIGVGLYYFFQTDYTPYKFANFIVIVVGVFVFIKSFTPRQSTPAAA